MTGAAAATLDAETSRWLRALHADGAEREAAYARLHARLLRTVYGELRRRGAHSRITGPELEDLAYVRDAFRPLDGPAAELVERALLPQPTYVLPDGTKMVPETHGAVLADEFRERFLAAGGRADDVDEELAGWLSGEYGACLRDPSPEAIVAKGALMTAIGALLARLVPDDAALRAAVDALDALERPFARQDRERFGGSTSRDRLITATRVRFPQLWS